MEVRFSQPGPPLSEADLAADRNGLGFPLPAAYRAWLLTTNGGLPKPRAFPTAEGRPTKRLTIERFLSHNPPARGVEDDVQSLYHHLVEEVGLPGHFLPVARGVGPELFFLDVRGADDGEVWHWPMYGSTYEDEQREGGFRKVCPAFATLLATLGQK